MASGVGQAHEVSSQQRKTNLRLRHAEALHVNQRSETPLRESICEGGPEGKKATETHKYFRVGKHPR